MIRHRGRYLAIAGAALVAGLVAIVLIPGAELTIAVADQPQATFASVASPNPDLLRSLDAAVAPPMAIATPKVENEPEPASAASVQLASLTTAAAIATPAVDPAGDDNLRADSIGSSAVNLRAGPSSSSQQLSVLQPGEAVQTGESVGGWIKVTRSDGSSGFISANYLSSNAAAQAAKVAAARPVAPSQTRATIKGDDGDLEDRTARIASRLTAYSRPGDSAEPIMTFSPGTRVRIAEVRGNWRRVETADGGAAGIKR